MGTTQLSSRQLRFYGAENDWEGKLIFNAPRHKTILNLPIYYPRINQFPEWFKVVENEEFLIVSNQKQLSGKYSGAQLLEGIPAKLKAGDVRVVRFPNRTF